MNGGSVEAQYPESPSRTQKVLSAVMNGGSVEASERWNVSTFRPVHYPP